MPDVPATQQSQMAERRGTEAQILIWFRARNRATGLTEAIGFWTGDDHQNFLVSGEVRTYLGAGTVINVPPVRAGIGLRVRQHRIVLPPLLDEVQQLLRAYDPRLAEVEVHSAAFDIDTGQLLAPPLRMIKGTLDKMTEKVGGKGREAHIELIVTSSARRLTFGLPLKRSNAELQRRDPTDRGREYSDTAGDVTVPWGSA